MCDQLRGNKKDIFFISNTSEHVVYKGTSLCQTWQRCLWIEVSNSYFTLDLTLSHLVVKTGANWQQWEVELCRSKGF